MSEQEQVILLWLLPSLCTAALALLYARVRLGKLEDGATEDWWMWFVASVVYPIGCLVLIFKVVWPFLIKERTLKCTLTKWRTL